MSGTLFISPHADDVCFTSYLLMKESVLPKPYALITCFSISNYTNGSKRHLYPSDASCIRAMEDEQFCRIFNARYNQLPFPCNLQKTGQNIFDGDARRMDVRIVRGLHLELKKLVKEIKPQNIVISMPSGKREHPDHRMVYQATRMLLKNEDIALFLVDDIPYSRIEKTTGYSDFSISCNKVGIQEKHSILENCYYSQSFDVFHNWIDWGFETNKNMERLFKVEKYDLSTPLFLCSGNELLSPAAQKYFNMRSMENGNAQGAYSRSIRCERQLNTQEAKSISREIGVNFDDNVPNVVSSIDIMRATHIFAMDSDLYQRLSKLYPEYTFKISLLSRFSSGNSGGIVGLKPLNGAESKYELLDLLSGYMDCIDNLFDYQRSWA